MISNRVLLLGIVFVLCPRSGPAQEADQSDRFLAQADRYRFEVAGSDDVFKRVEKPLLNWKNPARSDEDGAVFLWTHKGQPAVLGTCFTFVYKTEVRRKNAFRVLSALPIVGSCGGTKMWSPPPNTLRYMDFDDAPSPGTTERQRHTQLRGLARQFAVEVTDRDGDVEQCRLMPNPLYRYDSADSAGALFAFAVGTDPEAVLIIDRQVDDAGVPVWRYAWSRFTFYKLMASLNRMPVWEVERSESLRGSILSRPDYQREPYITFPPQVLD